MPPWDTFPGGLAGYLGGPLVRNASKTSLPPENVFCSRKSHPQTFKKKPNHRAKWHERLCGGRVAVWAKLPPFAADTGSHCSAGTLGAFQAHDLIRFLNWLGPRVATPGAGRRARPHPDPPGRCASAPVGLDLRGQEREAPWGPSL